MTNTANQGFNTHVLMSGADHFSDARAINPYMDSSKPIDVEKAKDELKAIRGALMSIGVTVEQVPAPEGCQDGIYTANWVLTSGKKAVMSRLPSARQAEEPYARKVMQGLGFETIEVPDDLRFSGQGDALPCGRYLFAGSRYRTDVEVHTFLADTLGFNVVSLQAVPKRGFFGLGRPVINKDSGWLDSLYYDIDLALSVLRPDTPGQRGLIAWCPSAFTPESQKKIEALPIDKIIVSKHEAEKAFACNLVSTGLSVVMTPNAPELRANIEAHGLKVVSPDIEITELTKGGGFIRCTTQTLNNPDLLAQAA